MTKITAGPRRFAGLAALGLGAALAFANPAGASEPGPDYEDVGPDYGHSRYERRHVEPPVVERRVVERTYSERRELVRPAYRPPAFDGPVYGRSAYSAPVYGRPVYARPHDDEDECRVVVKRRVNAWGDLVIRKTRVCG